jgi:uncharacterized membrane protein HdeD (DUF308 family)
MKAHELFGVALRVVGVWEVVHGLVQFPTWLRAYAQFVNLPSQVSSRAIGSAGIHSGTHIIVGIALFFGANWIVRLAYAHSEAESSPNDLQPLPKLPPHVKLPLLITGALVVSATYVWSVRTTAPQVSSTQPSTLHAAVLLAIGCAAVAFLVRNRQNPLEFFFMAWIAAAGLGISINIGWFYF